MRDSDLGARVASQHAELWRRWQSGESQRAIAWTFNMSQSAVRYTLTTRGGIAPAERRRSRDALTVAEREEISRGLAVGKSLRKIAAGLGRSPSTVSREVERNHGPKHYRAAKADAAAWFRAHRPKPCRLALHGRLRKIVAEKLRREWSPEQISSWLKAEHPDNKSMYVSHETIYRTLFIQARGALKKELAGHLRTRRKMRRPKKAGKRGESGQIVDAISIRERPAEVEDRAVPGHWEGDLLMGTRKSCIATLVERQSRFVMLVKVESQHSEFVVQALIKQILKLPSSLRRSLTWDRGHEMAQHASFSIATNVKVYFCDPGSPWQRGSNENTNGLLRQYFPKGTDVAGFTQAELNRVALRLNTRPRKTLGFKTPADMLNQVLH